MVVELLVNMMNMCLCTRRDLVAVFLCLILLSLIIIEIYPANAGLIVDIEMETSKEVYDVWDPVRISGNVTVDGALVTDALVALEIVSPISTSYLIRTVTTGEISSGYWQVQILDLYTCDSQGNPKTLFNKGAFVYVTIRLKNFNTMLTYHVKAGLYIQYSDNTPFIAFYPFEGDIEGGQEVNSTVSIQIPSSAVSGQALIFASLFSGSLITGGTAYCPEKITSFYIDTMTPQAPPQPQHFNVTFRLPKTNVKVGNYTIYARSLYGLSLATEIKAFKVVLLGDLVKDGKIDMRDIGAICDLYGKKEGDPNWNPEADFYKDGMINMRDIGIVSNNFGKSCIY